jgi:hypothetical protein
MKHMAQKPLLSSKIGSYTYGRERIDNKRKEKKKKRWGQGEMGQSSAPENRKKKNEVLRT